MARKAMVVKQQRKQKYATREYTRCTICGRPHSVLRKFGICRICFRELAYKGQIPGVRKEGFNMTMTDPIADMLTRIRNANVVKHETVDVPASNMKKELARILLEEGFIRGYDVIEDGKQGIIRIQLKYGQTGERVISGLKRISKPGMRVYADKHEVPRVLNGLGISIISTSKGILTDKQARKENVGGEVICYVW